MPDTKPALGKRSVAAVRAILAAERLRRTRLTGLKDFVQNLQAEL